MIDQIKRNNKKRYEMKHVLDQEYRQRDVEEQARAEERKMQRVKYDELVKNYDKGMVWLVSD